MLLKSAAPVCRCAIEEGATQRGVYAADDTVTEPADLTSIPGELSINVDARGNLNNVLDYVRSKRRSQYFILRLELRPLDHQRDEAAKFAQSLRERSKAGVAKLMRGRTLYLLPVSSSITRALAALGMAGKADGASTASVLYAIVLHPDARVS